MEDLVDHFVALDRLPDGFDFPPEMKDRIYFDEQRHQLVFHGYMSKSEFDHMCELTRDWKFRRKLEELFCLCVPDEPAPPGGARGFWNALKRRLLPG
jgi:hypothetical protein